MNKQQWKTEWRDIRLVRQSYFDATDFRKRYPALYGGDRLVTRAEYLTRMNVRTKLDVEFFLNNTVRIRANIRVSRQAAA